MIDPGFKPRSSYTHAFPTLSVQPLILFFDTDICQKILDTGIRKHKVEIHKSLPILILAFLTDF